SISSWESTNFIGRATEQDFQMGLIPYGDRILSFGENTCEHYYNAGNKAGSLLSRVSGRADRVGLSASFMHNGTSRTEYYCYVGNRLFFIGKDSESSGQLSLMTYNG